VGRAEQPKTISWPVESQTRPVTPNSEQEGLEQTGRLAALGTLVAGVAHELGTPLAYTTSNVEFAMQRTADVIAALEAGAEKAPLAAAAELRDVLAALREARDGIFRAGHIVRDLKSFAHSSDDDLAPIEVSELLESCVRLARKEIAGRARLVTDYAKVPRVLANELRLGQVFLNLVINAAQAIPAGRPDAHEIRLTTRVDAADRVVVTVRDTGSGMSPATMEKIFEPFFTTKKKGSGMGLGLFICQGIVGKLGGSITVESEPGQGSSFHVTLPSTESSSLRPPVTRVSVIPSMIPRQARILVVDDEPLIGASIRRGLGSNHHVHVVGNGRAALEALEGGQRFDVVVCDLMMPEMTGMELYDALSATNPAMAARMVFMTGGMLDPGAADFLNRVPNQRIPKPFDLEGLERKIAKALRSLTHGGR
jgi:signal transduction histidine kinase/ActR/RegA family two-component response regulator